MSYRSVFFLCMLAFPACDRGHDSAPQSSFGVYLTRYNVPPASLIALSHVDPADEPIIALDDVVSYTWSSHRLHISDRARRILDTLSVPTWGKSFCVCVDRSPRYCGAFWVPISSMSFAGTTIIMSRPTPDFLSISRGYPSDSDTSKPDPRNNSDVEAALRAAGKLR